MGRLNLRSPAARGVGVAAATLAFFGCATAPKGPVHVVQSGENLYRLSLHYDVSVDDIRAANGIRDVTHLQVGDRLVIPGANAAPPERSLAAVAPRTARKTAGSQTRSLREARKIGLDFRWPVAGKLSSRFGSRGNGRHDGIDIPAKSGTHIFAAEAGRVIHSGGGLGDYGNVVIVKHVGRFSTVYAHNRRNRVRKGEFVEKGQLIAEVGTSGNASGPHVHFEVRNNRRAEDPMWYLP